MNQLQTNSTSRETDNVRVEEYVGRKEQAIKKSLLLYYKNSLCAGVFHIIQKIMLQLEVNIPLGCSAAEP